MESSVKRKIVNTQGYCFLCLNSESIKNALPLHSLFEHLQIEEAVILSEKNNVKTSFPETVKTEGIFVHLCESCETISSRFANLSQQLKNIQMEMDYILHGVHRRIFQSTSDPSLFAEYSKRMTMSEADKSIFSQFTLVENLRKEIANKSLQKQDGPYPIIKLRKTKVISVKIKQEVVENDYNSETEEGNGLSEHDPDCPVSPLIAETNVNVSDPAEVVYLGNSSAGSYNCTSRYKPFQEVSQAQSHYPGVHPKKYYNCSICKEANFSHLRYLQRHKKICKGIGNNKVRKNFRDLYIRDAETGLYQCRQCNMKSKHSSYIVYHYSRAHIQKKYKCEPCGKIFNGAQSLYKHRHEVHLNSQFSCDRCDFKFRNSTHLKRHKESVHLGIKYPCRFCKKEFTRKDKVTFHEKKCSHENTPKNADAPKIEEDWPNYLID